MKKLFLLLFVASATFQIQAQNDDQNLKDGLAIQGYDTVAYFVNHQAVQGKKEISTEFNHATYYFSTEENKTLFLKNPTQYLPQFGGFCAYGMSEGHEAPVEPEAFTIVDGKLYLNYNLKVKEMWSKDREARIIKANENWKKSDKK